MFGETAKFIVKISEAVSTANELGLKEKEFIGVIFEKYFDGYQTLGFARLLLDLGKYKLFAVMEHNNSFDCEDSDKNHISLNKIETPAILLMDLGTATILDQNKSYNVKKFIPFNENCAIRNKETQLGSTSLEILSSDMIQDTTLVEDIVEYLRQKPPKNAICHIVLFGDRPLNVNHQGVRILCFTQENIAKDFLKQYQRTWHCTKPLSIIALGQFNELLAMLNNNAKDEIYSSEKPYGLIINFNYYGNPYINLSQDDIKKMGIKGLEKSFKKIE